MAYEVLPLDAAQPAYTVDVGFGGVLYRLALQVNTRGGYWTMGIYTTADEAIVEGIRIVTDWELLGQYSDSRLPPGRLFSVDLNEDGSEPTVDDLGSRLLVVYDDGADS